MSRNLQKYFLNVTKFVKFCQKCCKNSKILLEKLQKCLSIVEKCRENVVKTNENTANFDKFL